MFRLACILLLFAIAGVPAMRINIAADSETFQGGCETLAEPGKPFSFCIDLDLPPFERWRHVVDVAMPIIVKGHKKITDGTKDLWVKARKKSNDERELHLWNWDPELLEELRGIAHYREKYEAPFNYPGADYTLQDLMEKQVLYELGYLGGGKRSGCTGVVAAMENGTVVHGRNLDLGVPNFEEYLDKMTKVTFMKGGKPLFVSNHWLWQVGVGTGMRLRGHSFSVEQNSRFTARNLDEYADLQDSIRAAKRGGKFFTWEMRKTLETNTDFDGAVRRLEGAEWIAPQYIIMAGAGPWEGAVITVDRMSPSSTRMLTQRLGKEGRWFLVQPNSDFGSPSERRWAGKNLLEAAGQAKVSDDFVLGVMSTRPIFNHMTLLTAIFVPAEKRNRLYSHRDIDPVGSEDD